MDNSAERPKDDKHGEVEMNPTQKLLKNSSLNGPQINIGFQGNYQSFMNHAAKSTQNLPSLDHAVKKKQKNLQQDQRFAS